MGRAYSCWMLNCWCITWPVGINNDNLIMTVIDPEQYNVHLTMTVWGRQCQIQKLNTSDHDSLSMTKTDTKEINVHWQWQSQNNNERSRIYQGTYDDDSPRVTMIDSESINVHHDEDVLEWRRQTQKLIYIWRRHPENDSNITFCRTSTTKRKELFPKFLSS